MCFFAIDLSHKLTNTYIFVLIEYLRVISKAKRTMLPNMFTFDFSVYSSLEFELPDLEMFFEQYDMMS